MSELPRRRIRPGGIAVVLVVMLGLPFPAAPETRLGSARLSGDLTLGGRAMTGDWSSAKFNEYRWLQPGFYTNGLLLLEDSEQQHYLRAVIDYVSPDDMTYSLDGGRWGRYGFNFEFLEFPHNFSDNALSAYSLQGGDTLTLPPGWIRDSASLESNLDTWSRPVDLGFRLYDGRAGGFVKPREDMELDANFRIVDKRGTRPQSIGFGLLNFANVAAPIAERTYEMSAAAKMARERWSWSLDYRGALFRNDLESLTIDNPINGTDALRDPSRGRIATSPDNSVHTFGLSGSALLPTEFPAQFAGTFSYGLRTQNEDFIPATINTAIPPPGLPADSLNGKVNTWLTNLVLTMRPHSDVKAKARYRLYSYDNQTDSLSFTQGAVDVESPIYGYTRQNAMLDLSYRIAKRTTLRGGYEWENWSRDEREVAHMNEHKAKLRLDTRPALWAGVQLRYEFGRRTGNNYTPAQGEFELLRNFDESDRLLNRVDLLIQLDPRPDLGFTLNGSFRDADYDQTAFGTLGERGWQAGVDVSYIPIPRVTSSFYYTYDSGRIQQKSRRRPPDDDPRLDWVSESTSKAHNFGVDVELEVVPERLSAKLGYLYQHGLAETHSAGMIDQAVDYPDVKDTLQNLFLLLDYRVIYGLSLLFEYRWERWTADDFQTDPLGLYLGGVDVYMNNHIGNYDAHIFSWALSYEF